MDMALSSTKRPMGSSLNKKQDSTSSHGAHKVDLAPSKSLAPPSRDKSASLDDKQNPTTRYEAALSLNHRDNAAGLANETDLLKEDSTSEKNKTENHGKEMAPLVVSGDSVSARPRSSMVGEGNGQHVSSLRKKRRRSRQGEIFSSSDGGPGNADTSREDRSTVALHVKASSYKSKLASPPTWHGSSKVKGVGQDSGAQAGATNGIAIFVGTSPIDLPDMLSNKSKRRRRRSKRQSSESPVLGYEKDRLCVSQQPGYLFSARSPRSDGKEWRCATPGQDETLSLSPSLENITQVSPGRRARQSSRSMGEASHRKLQTCSAVEGHPYVLFDNGDATTAGRGCTAKREDRRLTPGQYNNKDALTWGEQLHQVQNYSPRFDQENQDVGLEGSRLKDISPVTAKYKSSNDTQRQRSQDKRGTPLAYLKQAQHPGTNMERNEKDAIHHHDLHNRPQSTGSSPCCFDGESHVHFGTIVENNGSPSRRSSNPVSPIIKKQYEHQEFSPRLNVYARDLSKVLEIRPKVKYQEAETQGISVTLAKQGGWSLGSNQKRCYRGGSEIELSSRVYHSTLQSKCGESNHTADRLERNFRQNSPRFLRVEKGPSRMSEHSPKSCSSFGQSTSVDGLGDSEFVVMTPKKAPNEFKENTLAGRRELQSKSKLCTSPQTLIVPSRPDQQTIDKEKEGGSHELTPLSSKLDKLGAEPGHQEKTTSIRNWLEATKASYLNLPACETRSQTKLNFTDKSSSLSLGGDPQITENMRRRENRPWSLQCPPRSKEANRWFADSKDSPKRVAALAATGLAALYKRGSKSSPGCKHRTATTKRWGMISRCVMAFCVMVVTLELAALCFAFLWHGHLLELAQELWRASQEGSVQTKMMNRYLNSSLGRIKLLRQNAWLRHLKPQNHQT